PRGLLDLLRGCSWLQRTRAKISAKSLHPMQFSDNPYDPISKARIIMAIENKATTVPKTVLLVDSSLSTLYLTANIVVMIAGGKAQSKIASFANAPVIPKAITTPHMIRGCTTTLLNTLNRTSLLTLTFSWDMIKPKANKDTPEVVPPINCNDSSASAGMGRAKLEKIAPMIGARTKGFLNTVSTKNMILVL